ncbi:uncharacterized protein J3D65DRAFT_208575 [Phyllosticta citribraziliensis]|uniref:Uncharacterized protein n=1 Tax=Phyllosticta citribraziliensis TaxID=989973 RepID=A0ABR1M3Y1_9PEZI
MGPLCCLGVVGSTRDSHPLHSTPSDMADVGLGGLRWTGPGCLGWADMHGMVSCRSALLPCAALRCAALRVHGPDCYSLMSRAKLRGLEKGTHLTPTAGPVRRHGRGAAGGCRARAGWLQLLRPPLVMASPGPHDPDGTGAAHIRWLHAVVPCSRPLPKEAMRLLSAAALLQLLSS